MLAYFKNIALSSAGSALLVKATLAAAILPPGFGGPVGRALRLSCTGDPGDSLPVPAGVGVAIRTGGVRAWPASPRPPSAGHAGAASPLAGPTRASRARVIRRPLPCTGESPDLGAAEGPGHVTLAVLSGFSSHCGGYPG